MGVQGFVLDRVLWWPTTKGPKCGVKLITYWTSVSHLRSQAGHQCQKAKFSNVFCRSGRVPLSQNHLRFAFCDWIESQAGSRYVTCIFRSAWFSHRRPTSLTAGRNEPAITNSRGKHAMYWATEASRRHWAALTVGNKLVNKLQTSNIRHV